MARRVEGRVEDRGDEGRTRLDAALTASGVAPDEVLAAAELGGGTFSTVVRVRRAHGQELVVKLAPGPEVPLMSHEHGLLTTEAEFSAVAANAPDVPVPSVPPPVAGDGTSPGGWLVMTRCRPRPDVRAGRPPSPRTPPADRTGELGGRRPLTAGSAHTTSAPTTPARAPHGQRDRPMVTCRHGYG